MFGNINTTTTKMDIRDFEGLTKYKLIVPGLFVINWILMFVGPSFFPVPYQHYCILALLYLLIRLILVSATTIKANIQAFSINSRAEQLHHHQPTPSVMGHEDQLYYGFIIPNYKEQIELLRETLQVLAKHRTAKENYLIFMAMEEHEPGSDLKAEELIKQFRHEFAAIQYTRHIVRQHEQKGKASNVSWCAQNLQPFFQKHMINPDSVFLTIIDADSWVPEVYMVLMDEHIKENYEKRFTYIYQPPQIFTRNNLDVPLLTRCSDLIHSFVHCGNLFSFFNVTFPLSNYTLSYNMAKRMGFWDTCAEAIGQDFHTTQKAYWKTGGKVTCVPINAPFNQVNICTDKGYWEDCKARFWQAERHARGVNDVAYNSKMLLSQPFRLKNFLLWFLVLDTFLVTTSVPWVFFGMKYQEYVVFQYERPSPELFNSVAFGYLFTMITIFGTLGYLMFELFKRRANKAIYQQQNESIFRLLEYIIFVVPQLYLISTPAFIIAAFGALLGNQEYVVADKKSTKKMVDE